MPRRTGDQHKPHWNYRRQTTAPLSCVVFIKPYRQGISQTLRVIVEGAACYFLAALSIIFPRDTNNRIHSNHKVLDSRLLELRNYFARTREAGGGVGGRIQFAILQRHIEIIQCPTKEQSWDKRVHQRRTFQPLLLHNIEWPFDT